MRVPACSFVLIHVYAYVCNLSKISINKPYFISAYCVKYTKASFCKFFEFFFCWSLHVETSWVDPVG